MPLSNNEKQQVYSVFKNPGDLVRELFRFNSGHKCNNFFTQNKFFCAEISGEKYFPKESYASSLN